MAALRSISVILAAAVVGVALSSLALFQSLDRGSFIALILAVPGTALVATSAGLLIKAGWDAGPVGLLIFAEGVFVGGLLLGVPGQAFYLFPMGAAYGGICAACWLALDFAVRRVRTNGH